MSEERPFLSVVIPAFNEGKRLGPTLERIIAYLRGQAYTWEVLVVNDGSTDDTVSVAEGYFSHLEGSQGTILHNPGNRGKGYSVKTGVLAARGEWVLMTDSDLSTPIEEVEKLFPLRQQFPILIGSRGLSASQLEERQPWYREGMGRLFNLMVQLVALWGIRDSQCGFKLFRDDAGKAIFEQTTIDGFGFDVECLFLARKLGYTIGEVPIRWINDPASKVDAIRDGARMAADLVRIRVRHRNATAMRKEQP